MSRFFVIVFSFRRATAVKTLSIFPLCGIGGCCLSKRRDDFITLFIENQETQVDERRTKKEKIILTGSPCPKCSRGNPGEVLGCARTGKGILHWCRIACSWRLDMKKEFKRIVVIAPTRSTCLNISIALENGGIPPTLLMQEKEEEIFEAVCNLDKGGFGIVAGTGTGKTVAIRDIAKLVLSDSLQVDIVTREHEATDYTWTCNVLVITPGVALHWLKGDVLKPSDLLIVDEIHQTSEHLELAMALAKRNGHTFVWMSATINPGIYAKYLDAHTIIQCDAYDPNKKARAECVDKLPDVFLEKKVEEIIEQKRAVAVFVPTRAMAEALAKKYGDKDGLYCDFYHGGESVDKLRQFLKGEVPKPFMIFMTIAGASSLNVLGLDTVVIVDEMYKEVTHSGVNVLEKVRLGNNELL